jgi:hypothetical protein
MVIHDWMSWVTSNDLGKLQMPRNDLLYQEKRGSTADEDFTNKYWD